MSYKGVRDILVSRLEEGDRGDRGWFIITRVHVALSWLKGIADYIEARGSGASVVLTKSDYKRLATIIETETVDPGSVTPTSSLSDGQAPSALAPYEGARLARSGAYNSWARAGLF